MRVVMVLLSMLLLAACDPPPGKHCVNRYELGLLMMSICED